MYLHTLNHSDQCFRADFERGDLAPAMFNHAAHVRLAYIYLAESDPETAVARMRDALLGFLQQHGIDRANFHETMTRAWVLAVHHFMQRDSSIHAADFIERNPELLDSRIMLTHYSAELLFSTDARSTFIAPDLDPIPVYNARPLVLQAN